MEPRAVVVARDPALAGLVTSLLRLARVRVEATVCHRAEVEPGTPVALVVAYASDPACVELLRETLTVLGDPPCLVLLDPTLAPEVRAEVLRFATRTLELPTLPKTVGEVAQELLQATRRSLPEVALPADPELLS
jgi:hypothetical protein